jgi:hypothetical protein
MKKYLGVLTSLNFLIMPLFMQSMTGPQRKTNTLLWLANNLIILASRDACYLKIPFSKRAGIKLHDELTHDIIVNKDKTKVGLYCSQKFYVYDIPTTKNIWSFPIAYNDNYSATFSPTDDIIIYHNGQARINYEKIIRLPFIQPDASFILTCNHKTKEIMYPSSNDTFSIKSLDNSYPLIYRSRTFNKDAKNYRIDAAIYSDQSYHIILHAHEKNTYKHDQIIQEFFLLHNKTNIITKITSPCVEEKNIYHQVKILPNSSIAAGLCNNGGIHFFDFIQQNQIDIDLFNINNGRLCKNNTNTLDFSDHATYYVVITNKKYFRRVTPISIPKYISGKNHICFIYLILRHYFQAQDLLMPKEIMSLLIQYLHIIIPYTNYNNHSMG